MIAALPASGLALAALAAAVAALAAVYAALRRARREVASLADAAERVRAGDLSAPTPPASGAEVSRLAVALEALRRRLAGLNAALTSRQAEAEAIVNSVVEGVFTVDRERRVRFVNPQMARILALDPQAAVGRFCGDVLRPEERGGGRPCEENCPIVHARFLGGARATEHLLAGSGRRTVVITSAPMNADVQVQVVRDESEVEGARRLRDAVLANVSHEFKTPLAAQLASIEMLRDRVPELAGQPAGELIGALERGTLRLTQLIDNLLESVRIEADAAPIRRARVNLEDVIEQAVELTHPLVEQRRQELAVDLPYPLPAIDGDARLLVQVFVNLIANANKFSPEESAIAIGGAVGPGEVTLWVEDQGPGLPDGDQDVLFNRFWRAASTSEQGGVGLGLYIVKSIVARHGGQVVAVSRENGTRMSVVLPVAAGPRA